MVDTLGLLAEAIQLACELGYDVREEPLGDTASGEVRIGACPTYSLKRFRPSR